MAHVQHSDSLQQIARYSGHILCMGGQAWLSHDAEPASPTIPPLESLKQTYC